MTINPPAEFYLSNFFSFAVSKGAKTVVILAENASFTLSIASGGEQIAANNNITVLEKIVIDRHLLNPIRRPPANYTAADSKQAQQLLDAVNRIKALNPDVVALGSYQDLIRNIMNYFFEANYVPKAIMSTSGLTPQLVKEYGLTGNHGTYVMGASAGVTGLRVRAALCSVVSHTA